MRSNEEIFEEVLEQQCIKYNCYSWKAVCLDAMNQMLKEHKKEIIEQLEQISNNYEVIDGHYVIKNHILNQYIENNL